MLSVCLALGFVHWNDSVTGSVSVCVNLLLLVAYIRHRDRTWQIYRSFLAVNAAMDLLYSALSAIGHMVSVEFWA